MAIITCENCGKKYSDKSPNGCPNCSGAIPRPAAAPATVLHQQPHEADTLNKTLKSLKLWVIISTVIISGLLMLGISAITAHKQYQYQYTIIAPNDSELDAELKTAGENGWEIVSSRRALHNGIGIYEIILKRTITRSAPQRQ